MTKENVNKLNASEAAYIEIIGSLIKPCGTTRVTDIAKALNISAPSVTEMLKKLDTLGFVEHKPYRNVTLTKKGKALAGFLKQTQLSLQNFLKLFDVTEHVAEADAYKMGHMLHESTLQSFSIFIDFVQNTAQGDALISGFKKYRAAKESFGLHVC